MFRLAHLSDIHLGPLPSVSVRQLASKRVTGYVNWQFGRKAQHQGDISGTILAAIAAAHPSHVAVTGDLINLGLDTEIENARLWLQMVGEPGSVSVVPGNHDAYVPGAFARALAAWRPWMQGDGAGAAAPPFPYLRIREGVALIGLSSARATAPFMATGYFRRPQAEILGRLLGETARAGLFRVVLIHHSPVIGASSFRRRLIGASLFRDVVRRHGAELVLHGHTHLPTLAWIEGTGTEVPVVGVAAAGQAPGGANPAAQYNLFEIDGAPGKWRAAVTRYGLGEQPAEIVALSRTQLHG
jgi:3',5'-cyclic AMP phosphodiesterase CpdA